MFFSRGIENYRRGRRAQESIKQSLLRTRILKGVFLWHAFASVRLVCLIFTVHTRRMAKLVGLLVFVAIIFGIYYLSLKKAPVTDAGTAPTQAISLTGVRSDLLKIAQAERSNMALTSHCNSLDELISSNTLVMNGSGRDGYTYEIQCSGDGGEFTVTARHAPAPEGSPIRYPNFRIDQSMQVGEIQ